MIISTSLKFAYVHIHKCAGTSVEAALSEVLGYNDLLLGSTRRGEADQGFFQSRLKLNKHSTAREMRDFLGPDRWAQYYTFALVRHPVDKLRSLYGYCRRLAADAALSEAERAGLQEGRYPDRLPFHYNGVKAAVVSDSFEAFVLNPYRKADPGAAPLSRSICDEDGTLIVDELFKIEEIVAAWPRIQERFPGTGPLPVMNVSSAQTPRGDPFADLGPETKDLLRKEFATDLALLNY